MSGRFSWVLALVVVAIAGALMGIIGSGSSAEQSPPSPKPTGWSPRPRSASPRPA
jgi:putative drug exporter of the RND superfamily